MKSKKQQKHCEPPPTLQTNICDGKSLSPHSCFFWHPPFRNVELKVVPPAKRRDTVKISNGGFGLNPPTQCCKRQSLQDSVMAKNGLVFQVFD